MAMVRDVVAKRVTLRLSVKEEAGVPSLPAMKYITPLVDSSECG
ncbi:hypothetical protein [Chryseobacterium limigenitum]|nr:hypothetical protein [Chryseobacterium limigenitum]